MRVIAIDPSLRSTGYAILENNGSQARALDYGTIKNPARLLASGCLVAIHEVVRKLIAQHQPDCAAIEGVIYVQSFRTAITLGAARGAAILALSEAGLPIYEYAPRRVKQATVGRGAAAKSQVGFMIRSILQLLENPPEDAADALAIGLTHIQTAESAARGALKIQQI